MTEQQAERGQTTYLRLGHGTSRGRDTYGYPIVSLTDETTGARVRCMGGGYDMEGTVLADWAEQAHPDRLRLLAERAHSTWRDGAGFTHADSGDRDALYGVYAYWTGSGALERVRIDGACGLDSVVRALRVAGIHIVKRTHDRRGNTTGWIVRTDDVVEVSA